MVRVEGGFALELQHVGAMVIERVNTHLGWRCVGRLLLRQGPLGAARPAPRRKPTDDPQARAEAERTSASIEDEGLRTALREGNAAYERKFGHVYLVCAGGRGGAELLAVLRSRMHNDPRTELGVVADELRKIALLRLEKVIA